MICRYCNGTGTSNTCVNGTFKPCAACNGTGEEKITNFDRITAIPRALAEFIYCLIEACDYAAGNEVKKILQYANEDANDKRNIELIYGNRDFGELLDWLNEESKE